MSESNKVAAPAKLRMEELLQGMGPIERHEFRALTQAVINIQNVLVNLMSLVDSNQEIANNNVEKFNESILGLYRAVQIIGKEVGVTVTSDQDPAPDKPTGHLH